MAKFPFEKSGSDKERKGGPKEGSTKEEAVDRLQARQAGKGSPAPKGSMPTSKGVMVGKPQVKPGPGFAFVGGKSSRGR